MHLGSKVEKLFLSQKDKFTYPFSLRAIVAQHYWTQWMSFWSHGIGRGVAGGMGGVGFFVGIKQKN